jgi:adsorption protein B
MTETFWVRTLEITLLSLGFLFLLGSLDDLLIDLAHFLLGLRPRRVSRFEWDLWKKLPERPMAIMIPAWKEHSVLEAMVKTNLHRLAYRNYRFFVGVYPNDLETLTIAKDLERRYPELVTTSFCNSVCSGSVMTGSTAANAGVSITGGITT